MQTLEKWREATKGILLTTASLGLATLVMFAIRSHVSVATAALVLVIPVIWGVVVGGFSVGLVGMLLGFLIYDFVFIPPYYTLTVGASQNWIALAVYVIVVLIVSRLVSNLKDAQYQALAREKGTRQLFELSELLIGDKKLSELLHTVVTIIQVTFQFESVALLLEGETQLEIMAHAGKEISLDELEQLLPRSGVPATLHWDEGLTKRFRSLALSAKGKPVGLLVMRSERWQSPDLDLLATFANNAALVIEQAQLRQQVLHAERLEETDRWRRALLGSVSHDLRTPLSSIKAAASDLNDKTIRIEPSQRDELLTTIVSQTDHLTRLVVNLLDMTRIEAGVLRPHLELIEISELINEGISALGDASVRSSLRIENGFDELYVEADHILVSQVIANLLENARRYSPPDGRISIETWSSNSEVFLAVSDSGPGIPEESYGQVFEMFHKDSQGGRAGLGLAIAKAFIAAHGRTISVSKSSEGGAKFSFSLPLVSLDESEYLNGQASINR